MKELEQHLSNTLKRLRQQNQWSLDKTAEKTGVSKAMLGQIERGESSPTVATLWKIADGFHQSLSTFLEPPISDKTDTVVIRSSTQLRKKPASDEMLIAPLFPYEERFRFELLELTLLPGYERFLDPHKKGVTEHIIVLKGEMEVFLDEEWINLSQGSAVRFTADKPHGYRNKQQLAAVFHNLIYYT